MKFNKKKYMKHYNYCYQKALSILRSVHMKEFKELLAGLLKGGKDGNRKEI